MNTAPKNDRKLNRYKRWHQGLMDRLRSQPCASSDGDYLDGWYSPKNTLWGLKDTAKAIPDFLTPDEAALLRREMTP